MSHISLERAAAIVLGQSSSKAETDGGCWNQLYAVVAAFCMSHIRLERDAAIVLGQSSSNAEADEGC